MPEELLDYLHEIYANAVNEKDTKLYDDSYGNT